MKIRYRWRDSLSGRFIKAPLGLLSKLLKMLTVKERI